MAKERLEAARKKKKLGTIQEEEEEELNLVDNGDKAAMQVSYGNKIYRSSLMISKLIHNTLVTLPDRPLTYQYVTKFWTFREISLFWALFSV